MTSRSRPRCHLFTTANYYTSLFQNHPPPAVGEPPYIINGWSRHLHGSPFRIGYGTLNPAIRGLVLTATQIVPNFSFTPRLAVSPECFEGLFDRDQAVGEGLVIMVPAVHGRVVRLFASDGL